METVFVTKKVRLHTSGSPLPLVSGSLFGGIIVMMMLMLNLNQRFENNGSGIQLQTFVHVKVAKTYDSVSVAPSLN